MIEIIITVLVLIDMILLYKMGYVKCEGDKLKQMNKILKEMEKTTEENIEYNKGILDCLKELSKKR